MKIQLPSGPIELTREQLMQAHNEYVELCKMETAKETFENYVITFCLNHSSGTGAFDAVRKCPIFFDTYGFYPEDGLDPESPHYVLGSIYCDHEQKAECYEDDDDAWTDAVKTVMDDIEDHKDLPIAAFGEFIRSQYALDVNTLHIIDDIVSYAKDTFTDVETLRGFLQQLCGSVLDADDIARVVLN